MFSKQFWPRSGVNMVIKFCAQCGNELTTKIDGGRERPACRRCGYIVYRNPAPVGLVVATRDDKLLLIHRVRPPLAGYWAPPTGYVEIDESIEEAAVREAKEETGLDMVVERLLKVYSRANMGVMLLAYATRIAGGALAPGEDDVDGARFFTRDELPRQPAPANETPLDQWFFEIVSEIVEKFRWDGGCQKAER